MYSPIVLLCITSKVMEAFVQIQLQSYFIGNHLISDKQFGSRPHQSAADLLTILAQTLSDFLDQGNEVRLIALDIKGAFDKVWHSSKLSAKGVTGKLIPWIRSYVSDRSIPKLFHLASHRVPLPSMHQFYMYRVRYLAQFWS